MSKDLPFDDEAFTVIMGLCPTDPGMHGRLQTQMPTDTAVDTIIKIKDLCEAFLAGAGKDCKETDSNELPECMQESKEDK